MYFPFFILANLQCRVTLCGISSGYSLFVKVSVFHCLLQYQVATDKRLPPAIIGQSIVCNVIILSLKYEVSLLTVCSIMGLDLLLTNCIFVPHYLLKLLLLLNDQSLARILEKYIFSVPIN